ncbi:MAG: permease [Pseudomonadota bacterium]
MTELALKQMGSLWRGLQGMDRVWALVALIPLVIILADPDRAGAVLATAANAFAGTMPYMAIAIAMIAYLKASGSEGVISAAFQGKETRMIVLAALVGGLAPFCSCEVIPFVAALLAAGTPLSAVMAFWLASPLMDPPTFAITTGALGVEYAIGKGIAAVSLGLMGGFVVKAMTGAGWFADVLKPQKSSGCCGCGPNPLTSKPVWKFWTEEPRRRAFGQTALEQALFLGKWLAFAYLIEGMMIHYVPAENIAALVGGEGLMPIVIGAFVGAPAYLNGYAAPALIAGLMEQGMSAGAAMSFMVAGAVSSIPAMAAVFALVRREVFATYMALGIGGAILSGVVFAAVVPQLG